jgi:transcriptional regulator with XRE-family HTH domain
MSIGERLKEERERLTLSQTNFADMAGIHRKSQANYETNERSPDAAYLATIASAGVDVLYVLTGMRNENVAGTRTEMAYLRNCRALSKVNAHENGLQLLTILRQSLGVDFEGIERVGQ